MKLQSYFKFVLIAIPIVMISWQLYASNFDSLTPWKGGGYGMYTESHRQQGMITLKNSSREQRIFPLSLEEYNKLDSLSRVLYENDKFEARKFTYYPNKYFNTYKNTSYLNSLSLDGDSLLFISVDLDLNSKSILFKTIFKDAL